MLFIRLFRQGAGDPAPHQPRAAASVQAPPSTGTIVRITRDDAGRMSVDNNPELAVSRYDPAISETQVAPAKSAFVPTLQTGSSDTASCSRR